MSPYSRYGSGVSVVATQQHPPPRGGPTPTVVFIDKSTLFANNQKNNISSATNNKFCHNNNNLSTSTTSSVGCRPTSTTAARRFLRWISRLGQQGKPGRTIFLIKSITTQVIVVFLAILNEVNLKPRNVLTLSLGMTFLIELILRNQVGIFEPSKFQVLFLYISNMTSTTLTLKFKQSNANFGQK